MTAGRTGPSRVEPSTLDHTFSAVLQKSPKPGGWTYLVMSGSAEYFGTRGLVEVRGDTITVHLDERLG